VLLWFVGLSFLAAWLVFRDPALDYRLVMAGALLPDALDAPSGGAWVGHSVAGASLLLAVVMLGTRGRRAWRRRLLALPIGVFLHLLLDGAWADAQAFWWPVGGLSFGGSELPVVERGRANLLLELMGLGAAAWAWRRFRLHEPDRRHQFLRTGRLGRDLVA
jgi:hypothetical protein